MKTQELQMVIGTVNTKSGKFKFVACGDNEGILASRSVITDEDEEVLLDYKQFYNWDQVEGYAEDWEKTKYMDWEVYYK